MFLFYIIKRDLSEWGRGFRVEEGEERRREGEAEMPRFTCDPRKYLAGKDSL